MAHPFSFFYQDGLSHRGAFVAARWQGAILLIGRSEAGVKRTLQARQTPGCAVQVVDAHGCNVECCGLTIWLVLRVYAKMNTRIAKHTSRRGDERRQRITLAREGGGHGRVAAPPGAGSFSSHDSASTAATSTAFASALCEVCLAAAMAARAAGAFVRARA